MTLSNQKTSNLVDNLIFTFSIIFILTSTNSIFLNQLGYYGALLSILLKYYLEKKNPFSKTGLELVFLIFIIAEILSTIFSIDVHDSFRNLLKKFLLIPTLYVFIAASKDFDRVKQFVIIYIAGASLTLIYYLIRSYDYFINNLYQTQASGPSVFQYPITSSELMCFSVLILFAFLINEKSSFKYKLLVLILFLINLLALIATYKRTGWMGAAAGILLILFLSRKWFLLTAILLLGLTFGLLNKNISQVGIYTTSNSDLVNSVTLNTNGRASSIFLENNKVYISDFENGLLILKDSTVINKIKFPAPVVEFIKWRDSFYVARLFGTRFILLKSDSSMDFKFVSEFLTPGRTIENKIANKMFYIYDEDSGLTIIKDPNYLQNRIRFQYGDFLNQQTFFIDSSHCVFFSKSKELIIYQLKNYLPDKMILREKLSDDNNLIGLVSNKLVFSSAEELKLYSFDFGKLNLVNVNKRTGNILFLVHRDELLFGCNSAGEFFEFEYPVQDKLIIKSNIKLNHIPGSIDFHENKIYTTFTKTSRFSSFIDPYYPTNYSRLAFWKAGWEIFKDYPLLGVGDIDLAKLYKVYKRPYDKEIQGHLHNNYFHSLATLGTIGFIAIMFLFIKIFLVHLSLVKKLKSVPFASSFSLGAIGGYVSFLVAGLTEYNFGDHEVITLVWFTLALSMAFARNLKVERSTD